ncbi:hypothetical protein EYF80_022826 [Liparis tanakae]|uniref:Uncharacterized protein n=1 Tax=Liparis tanakae TaxID=230148 RepID=A0A4Z2HLZ1_9TELE|nr:hypothetical protein EYF80_022826 [Liparis tanakae]
MGVVCHGDSPDEHTLEEVAVIEGPGGRPSKPSPVPYGDVTSSPPMRLKDALHSPQRSRKLRRDETEEGDGSALRCCVNTAKGAP